MGILRYANEEVGVVIDQDQGVAYMEADPFASPGNLERGLDFLEEHGYCLEPEESYDPYAEPESNSLGWDRHYALPKAEWNA